LFPVTTQSNFTADRKLYLFIDEYVYFVFYKSTHIIIFVQVYNSSDYLSLRVSKQSLWRKRMALAMWHPGSTTALQPPVVVVADWCEDEGTPIVDNRALTGSCKPAGHAI
jgi:hypothetical protein